MAELNRHAKSVVQAVNVDVNATWDVQTAVNISSQAQVHKDLNANTQRVGIYSDSDVYFTFTTLATTANSATNDLIIPSKSLRFIRVPTGIRERETDIIYLHIKQVVSVASRSARIVEV